MNNLDVGVIPNVTEAADASGYSPPTAGPDPTINYANNEDVRRFIEQELFQVLTWCRKDRVSLEEEWRAVRRMATLEHDEGQRYLGRSNAYVPVYQRTRSTLVSQLARGLFPSDEYMDVTAQETGMEEMARAKKQYMQYQLEGPGRLRANLKPFLRQFTDIGMSIGKVWYAKEEARQKKTRLTLEDIEKKVYGEKYETESYMEGIRFKARSAFSWYIWPVTADSLREATLVFEDILVPRTLLKEKGRKGLWRETEQALSPNVPAEFNLNMQELLSDTSQIGAIPAANPLSQNEVAGQIVVTELWCALPLPASAYVAGEDKDTPVPCRIVLAGTHILEVRRNPYWHQCLPYLVARDEWEVPSFYPRGVGHRLRALQYLVNDFTNQTNDNGTYGLNPVVKLNPSLLAGPLPPLAPGAVWPMTDVDAGAKFDRPPVEQLQYGMQLINMFIGMAQDFGGAPPIIQGTGAGKAGKTATQAQILQRNAMNPLQDIVEDLEGDVMTPLLLMADSLCQQYHDGDEMAAIAGMALKMPREAFAKQFGLKWLASSQAVNQQQRAQQIMQLLQVVGPMMPLLQQSGYQMDPTPLLRRLYSDGFGLRDFDKFIFKAPMQMGQPGMGPPGAPGMSPPQGGPPAPGEGNQYSATENANMAPGEGDDFASVRDNADDISAELGSMSNMP